MHNSIVNCSISIKNRHADEHAVFVSWWELFLTTIRMLLKKAKCVPEIMKITGFVYLFEYQLSVDIR